jgi:hypothetical protein
MKEIKSFKDIETERLIVTPYNIQFYVEYLGYDINGNPRYRLKVYDYITAQKIKNAKGRGGKFYMATQTLYFISYKSIAESIEDIFEKSKINSGLK